MKVISVLFNVLPLDFCFLANPNGVCVKNFGKYW